VPSWLIDALRAPGVELVNLLGLALLAAVTQRLRGKQKHLRVELQALDVLPPKSSESSSLTRAPSEQNRYPGQQGPDK
jgi:hypothetical protein